MVAHVDRLCPGRESLCLCVCISLWDGRDACPLGILSSPFAPFQTDTAVAAAAGAATVSTGVNEPFIYSANIGSLAYHSLYSLM